MRAVAIREFGGPEKLEMTEISRPRPERGEVLLRVVAAGVNPVDWKIRKGLLADRLPHRFPIIPGWDVAGVVEELGEGGSSFRKGDRVFAYARKPHIQWGTYAEYVAVPERDAALMPPSLLFEEAASVPLAALTARQAMLGQSPIGSGAIAVVHAAAGGVGQFAVQFARLAGARVLGTAGTANQSFLLSLGAEIGIDYTREDFRDGVRRISADGVDFVLDAVGGETLARSYEIVRPGGRIVSIVEAPDSQECRRRGFHGEYLSVVASGERLIDIARLFDQKKLRTHVQKIYALSQAAEAHRVSESGHVQGKLVLNL